MRMPAGGDAVRRQHEHAQHEPVLAAHGLPDAEPVPEGQEVRVRRCGGHAVLRGFSGGILDADVNSDFGRAVEQFRNGYPPSLNHRTTLVILGDGRNNGKKPNAEALEEISHHVRQTIWITPEPKWGWALGSCDMPLYEPLCDHVEVVRSVDQLAGVAEELVRARV